jgi:hypothetical protein
LNTLSISDEYSLHAAETAMVQSLNDVQNAEDETQIMENDRQWISRHHSESENEREQETSLDSPQYTSQ